MVAPERQGEVTPFETGMVTFTVARPWMNSRRQLAAATVVVLWCYPYTWGATQGVHANP